MTQEKRCSCPHVIEVSNLCKVFKRGSNTVNALNGIELTVAQGDFVAIMGASGSGKSTLLHLLGCLDTPTSGSYSLAGCSTDKLTKDQLAKVRNKKIGFVFQNFNLLSRLTALENVILPIFYSSNLQEIKQRGMEALSKVGLEKRASHMPNELSGGESQRVAIARALVNHPSVLLADEPTGALDSTNSAEMMQLIKNIWLDGTTIVLVTHDHKVASCANRIEIMKDGVFVTREALNEIR